ncbi:hypothetical protein Acr_28g0009370 [Actinidia rufa]|uniref:NAD(P)-binding Rossmann-fold superfamily protein n=1 Tax=Actinidia rufa TaxID=165716 RepID=A0A7J0HAU8_9ERIC|nr:hypothetical protein Acr_28g0009370 [Actinidia rufa]
MVICRLKKNAEFRLNDSPRQGSSSRRHENTSNLAAEDNSRNSHSVEQQSGTGSDSDQRERNEFCQTSSSHQGCDDEDCYAEILKDDIVDLGQSLLPLTPSEKSEDEEEVSGPSRSNPVTCLSFTGLLRGLGNLGGVSSQTAEFRISPQERVALLRGQLCSNTLEKLALSCNMGLGALEVEEWRLEGKVALITGGAGGIGSCAAKLFCKQGAKVVIADVQDNQGRSICNDIGPTHASFVHCDVTNETDVGNAIDMVVADHGKLDIMVNNAGIMDTRKPNILDTEIAEFENVIRVNLTDEDDPLDSISANLGGLVLKPKDVAQAVYLASEESNHVNGHNLIVDRRFTTVNTALMMFNG